MANQQIVDKVDYEKDYQTDCHPKYESTENIAKVMFPQINARIANHDSPKKDNKSK